MPDAFSLTETAPSAAQGVVILADSPKAFASLLDGLCGDPRPPAPSLSDHIAAWEAMGGSRADFGFMPKRGA